MAAARGGLAPHARATEEGARAERERGRCEREGAGGPVLNQNFKSQRISIKQESIVHIHAPKFLSDCKVALPPLLARLWAVCASRS